MQRSPKGTSGNGSPPPVGIFGMEFPAGRVRKGWNGCSGIPGIQIPEDASGRAAGRGQARSNRGAVGGRGGHVEFPAPRTDSGAPQSLDLVPGSFFLLFFPSPAGMSDSLEEFQTETDVNQSLE